MPRLFRNTLILGKIETTYATDAAPVPATDALLVSDCKLKTLDAKNVDRNLIRPFLGGSEQLVGDFSLGMDFTVELAGSGTAGTAPAWGKLLRACAFAETVTAAARVEYTPITSSQESLTIYYYLDGVVRKALGCRGTVSLDLGQGNRAQMKFSFTGLDGGIVATAVPSPTLTAWKPPRVVTDANSGDITFGGTYATGAVTGGTIYPSRGITIDIGNKVEYIPLLGGQSVDITDRAVTGKLSLDATGAQDVSFLTSVKANTLQSVSMVHGSVAGNIITVFAPAVQLINPDYEDLSGRALNSYDLRFVPVSGNDELRIVAA